MDDSSYVGFLDLVGVRELARSDRNKYFNVLFNFREKVKETVQIFQSKPQDSHPEVYLFSDCIYYQVNSLEGVLDFTQTLRHLLMMDAETPIFFTGALGVGSLNPETLEPGSHRASGFVFGTDASSVYCEQEILRGIGVNVTSLADSVSRKHGEKHACTPNAFLNRVDSISLDSFYDLKFNANTLTEREDVFSRCFKSFSDAIVQSPRFSRYYVPLMINLFSSVNYSELSDKVIEFDIDRDEAIRQKLHNIRYFGERETICDEDIEYCSEMIHVRWHPYNVIRRDWLNKHAENIPAYESILLSTIESILKLRLPSETPASHWKEPEQVILRSVIGSKAILDYMKRVPEVLLPSESRKILLEEASKRQYNI